VTIIGGRLRGTVGSFGFLFERDVRAFLVDDPILRKNHDARIAGYPLPKKREDFAVIGRRGERLEAFGNDVDE
jgi:hypothetical protein